MAKRHPSVSDNQLVVDGEDASAIVVGSAAWFAWLAQHNWFRLDAPSISFIVRKEKRHSGWYWYAQRRQQGQVQTAYLGKSEELDLQRLNGVTTAWQSGGAPISASRAASSAADEDPKRGPGPELLRQVAPPAPLPTPLTSFVGREEEIAAVTALLRCDDVRLVRLLGTGGIGKTRIALRVAAELEGHFADGVYFLALAAIRVPQLVLPAIAQELGLFRDGDKSAAEVLVSSVQQREMLLVLDNLEQVTPVGPLLGDLLVACPWLKLLVTSREALHLGAEHQFPVQPLIFPEPSNLPELGLLARYPAVRLFIQRAQFLAPQLALDAASLHAIADICAKLEGLPLAIELAAARARLLSPQALLPRLTERLLVLTQGGPDRPTRHQTLRATLDWSHDLLTDEEQRVFRRIAVFVGGCYLEATESVCTILADVSSSLLDVLTSLMDKSLLQVVDSASPTPRLRMSDTVREYALELLLVHGELEHVQEAHAAYYLRCAEQADRDRDSGRYDLTMTRLETDNQNLSAALSFLIARHDRERALRFVAALGWFWYVRGCLSEGLDWIEGLLCERTNQTNNIAERMRYTPPEYLVCIWGKTNAHRPGWRKAYN